MDFPQAKQSEVDDELALDAGTRGAAPVRGKDDSDPPGGGGMAAGIPVNVSTDKGIIPMPILPPGGGGMGLVAASTGAVPGGGLSPAAGGGFLS